MNTPHNHKTIQTLLDEHFPKGSLQALFPLLEKHEIHTLTDLKTALAKIKEDDLCAPIKSFLEACKTEGLCQICPNNGLHKIESYVAWDLWVQNKDLGWHKNALLRTPAFRSVVFGIQQALQTFKDAVNNVEAINNRPQKQFDEFELFPISKEQLIEILSWSEEQIRQFFLKPPLDDVDHRFLFTTHVSHFDDSHHAYGHHPLTPVLYSRNHDRQGHYERSTSPDVPAPLRMVTLKLPSQQMVVSDVFRFTGYKEGEKALMGKERLSLNSSKGIDTHSQKQFETLGVVCVQTTQAPTAYLEKNGLWRFGFVNEDHDHFYPDDSDEPVGLPKPAFKTASDVWCCSITDPKSVIKIMMASGLFESEKEAQAAFTQEMLENDNMALVDVGSDEIHVYMPTGITSDEENYDEIFSSPDVPKAPWREDNFIVSTKPITVDETLFEKHNWVQNQP